MKNSVTRRFMRKMRRFTRRASAPFRTKSLGKLMRKLKEKQRGGAGEIGLIKVPAGTMNFNFAKAVSTLPASFGTFAAPAASAACPNPSDCGSFTINLAPTYSPTNLPQFLVTGYVYSTTAGYIHVQRQFGVQTGTAAAQMAIDSAVKKVTFTNVTKGNFPSTANDAQGYALYIAFNIIN